jgi:hypothetical protein
MLAYYHNGTISMDATFGRNDVKSHLVTLMGFYVYKSKISVICASMLRIVWVTKKSPFSFVHGMY